MPEDKPDCRCGHPWVDHAEAIKKTASGGTALDYDAPRVFCVRRGCRCPKYVGVLPASSSG